MVDRPKRLAQFVTDRPPDSGVEVQLLCEDNRGTYTPPFLCVWTSDGWISAATSDRIDTIVLGWRTPQDNSGTSRPFWAHRLSALRAKR